MPSPDETCIDIDAKVQALRQTAIYPDKPDRVEAMETHMSWLFLTDHQVYKLKKPLRYDFLDFSTVEARRKNCEAEVRLNRRLSADIYLGVLPLTVDSTGAIGLGGNGQVIDWLVKMRRLPGAWALDHRIEKGNVDKKDVVKLALALAEFYEKTPPVALSTAEYLERFEKDINDHLRELMMPAFGLAAEWVKEIAHAQLQFLKDRAGLFAARVQAGRVIEAHGDLRPEHIYLGPQPVIIDGLEFNRAFRVLDAADELAFLAMECERLEAPFIGAIVFDTYRRVSSDDPPAELLHFYMIYRAVLWAKLAIRHVDRPGTGERSKWVHRTNAYLRLADRHMQKAQ